LRSAWRPWRVLRRFCEDGSASTSRVDLERRRSARTRDGCGRV